MTWNKFQKSYKDLTIEAFTCCLELQDLDSIFGIESIEVFQPVGSLFSIASSSASIDIFLVVFSGEFKIYFHGGFPVQKKTDVNVIIIKVFKWNEGQKLEISKASSRTQWSVKQ